MLTRIDDIQLYMGITPEAADCYHAKKYLEDAGVGHVPYMYSDESQHADNFAAISSWKLAGAPAEVDKFPFVIYTEVHDDLPPSQYPKKMLYGLEDIKASNIAELYQVGR
jgi:hypothetical protein